MVTKGTLAVLSAALVAAGCAGSTTVRSTGPQTVESLRGQAVSGPYVPAGTEFNVRMNDAISTATSVVGRPFTATLLQDLTAPDGRMIAPAGSTVRGRVAGLMVGRMPMIRLEFSSLQTVNGSVPIRVAVRRTDRITFRGDERVVQRPAGPLFNTAVYTPTFSAPFQNSLGDTHMGYAILVYEGRPREVRLEPGTRLRLQFTRTLLAPGSVAYDITARR